jgi:hypothetical protein
MYFLPRGIRGVKTTSVRIKAEQAHRLHEIADNIPGFSINGAVQRAVELWLEVEGPVYLEAFDGARKKLIQQRQPVVMELRN